MGESIAESLVSILVVALASIMFAGMVTASRSIIEKSSNWMQNYYNAVSVINRAELSEATGSGVNKGNANIQVGGAKTTKLVTTFTYEVGGVKIVSYVPAPTTT